VASGRENAGIRWRRRLGRLAAFTLSDWRCAGEALVTLPLVDLAARFVPPARLLGWATDLKRAPAGVLAHDEIRRVSWLVMTMARYHVVRVPCLARSLTLARLLARRGVETDVRVGVRSEAGRMAAHAWVEWQARPLGDEERIAERYAPLVTAVREMPRA
jgi:transglutaminase superfamily protein